MIALNEEPGGKTPARSKTKTGPTEDFQNMVDLLAVYSAGENLLAILQEKLNEEMLSLVDKCRGEYAELQEALTKAETGLEILARRHPEWFETKKSIKTPYGTVKFHTGTHLEVTNDEATVKLLRAEEKLNPQFASDDYIRIQELPNIEALEGMDDSTLARFMVKRVKEEKFSVTAAKLDLGKAVKESAAKGK